MLKILIFGCLCGDSEAHEIRDTVIKILNKEDLPESFVVIEVYSFVYTSKTTPKNYDVDKPYLIVRATKNNKQVAESIADVLESLGMDIEIELIYDFRPRRG